MLLEKSLCFVCLPGILLIFFTFGGSDEIARTLADKGVLPVNCAFGNIAGYSMEQAAANFVLQSGRICLFCVV
jgi:hypothetical protein